ncbi:MAG: SpoIIE family protein phosphatase [Lachnospiraceae bacterium]|nr:SpoIIE family protein phosphatase [Lachnospiraceae bacterium]
MLAPEEHSIPSDRWPVLFCIPIVADLVITIIYIFLFLTPSLLATGGVTVTVVLSAVSYVIAYGYVMVSVFVLWKRDRILTVLPVLIAAVTLYFEITSDAVVSKALMIALGILYIYVSELRRSLLIRIGGIMVALFVLIIAVIGNEVTSAAFTSYLVTLHDRNDEHLKEVEKYMERFEALPWLIDYWTDNAVRVKECLESKDPSGFSESELYATGITEAETMTDEMQLLFASACYKSIDKEFDNQYEIHNLDDLFLIVPYGNDQAVKLFDAEKHPDGSYALGDDFDIRKKRREWDNYNAETGSDTHWTWDKYSRSDDFGFFRTIDASRKGNTALLCNSFKRSEIYAHMDYMSAFRTEAMGYLAAVAAVILFTLYMMILRPMAFMSNTMKRYRTDKDADIVERDMEKIVQKDEIGAFAKDFTDLTSEMNRYTEEVAHLAGERERVATELQMAADIQVSALPRVSDALPSKSTFDVFAYMRPAKEVGGDFYDFFMTDSGQFVFLIADVSDKGVQAALFMMSAKGLINYRAREGGTPAGILSSVNDQLCRNNTSRMFATVWIGILDPDTGVIKCANAGHEHPAVSDGKGVFTFIGNDVHGPAIGIVPGFSYKDYEIKLDETGSVFLYTDGVIEAKDPSGSFYGEERMIADINGLGDVSPELMTESLTGYIDDHIRDAVQFDDMTMLCLKYYGNIRTS